jgi:hypothetical protein
MYQKLRDNIINPKGLLNRMKEKPLLTFGFFMLFASILALPGIIRVISFNELTPNIRTSLRQELVENLNIPCTINETLSCETNEIHTIEQDTFRIILDPANKFVPSNTGIVVVLQESSITAYSNEVEFLTTPYVDNQGTSIWPNAWDELVFDVDSDAFWNQLFLGIDQFLEEYEGIWKSTFVVSVFLSAVFLLFVDVMLDTIILSFFRFSKLRFGSLLKIVVHTMTLYVLITAILQLWGLVIPYGLDLVLQLQPIIYAVIAIRSSKEFNQNV